MNSIVADTLTPATQHKLDFLESTLADMASVAVAFSGGVDSTLLLKVAFDVLGTNCVAVSGLSETYAPEEISEAKSLASEIGCEYVLLQTMELSDPRYADNTHQRCFFCKQELYGKIAEFAKTRAIAVVVDGTNADDAFDFRPGLRAARDLGVRSPLQEVGLTKAEIREISATLGLPTADKPAVACLSSRFSFGDKITVEKLSQVAQAESAIKRLGFAGFRLRHHDTLARLEFRTQDLDRALSQRQEIVAAVKDAGYRFVTIDLEGYRSGNMNDDLPDALIHIRPGPSGNRGVRASST